MTEDKLILVDLLDRPVGESGKLPCHQKGLLHRAFSIVLTHAGSAGTEVLLARRAEGKYHSGGLWSNSCCSHPRVGEELGESAMRRLEEELGVRGVTCREAGTFVYRAAFENGLTEYELDHVFVGTYDGPVCADPSEVSEVCWMDADELVAQLTERPQDFTAWCPAVTALALRSLTHR